MIQYQGTIFFAMKGSKYWDTWRYLLQRKMGRHWHPVYAVGYPAPWWECPALCPAVGGRSAGWICRSLAWMRCPAHPCHHLHIWTCRIKWHMLEGDRITKRISLLYMYVIRCIWFIACSVCKLWVNLLTFFPLKLFRVNEKDTIWWKKKNTIILKK